MVPVLGLSSITPDFFGLDATWDDVRLFRVCVRTHMHATGEDEATALLCVWNDGEWLKYLEMLHYG